MNALNAAIPSRNFPYRYIVLHAGKNWIEGARGRVLGEKSKMAKRIQRKRTKGWKMPENTVYVGRPTAYGNPWKIDDPQGMTAERAVDLFRRHRAPMITKKELKAISGKDLACWCKVGEPCHADVLLEIANPGPTPDPERGEK